MLPEDKFATSIDSTHEHTCAVMDDGSVYCWGRQFKGNMGTGSGDLNGEASKTPNPIKVKIPTGKFVSFITIGKYHGCAVMADDSLWCWGYNQYGEVGLGNVSTSAAKSSENQSVDIIYPPIS